MATRLISHFKSQTSFHSKSKSNSTRRQPSRYMPTVIAMVQNQSYWNSIEDDVESYLKKAIPIRSPESVFEPMHHLTFSAPRTIAPSLCVAACEFVGGERSHALAAASAIHLMHAAAYIHEHLPLTDRPRPSPKPTIPHRYDPNIELLTGDGIIPFGLELLAKSMNLAERNQDKILRAIIEITRASGSQGMVDGQYHELGVMDFEVFEYVCRKKEGELHACGAACGAILGGGDEVEIERLRSFGRYVGMVQGMQMTTTTAKKTKNYPGMEEKIEKWKVLALRELEIFGGTKVELLCSLVEPSLVVAQI